MNHVYHLRSDTANYSSFIQDYDSKKEESIMARAVRQRWRPFSDYEPIKLELRASDSGKKNYLFDVSGALFPFYVFSEKSIDVIGSVILKSGQVLPVETDSKKKVFLGYYPTKTFSGCLDTIKSIYKKFDNEILVRKPVLILDNIPDDPLFTIEESSKVFVTSSFKKIVEDAGLLGFDFSEIVETT